MKKNIFSDSEVASVVGKSRNLISKLRTGYTQRHKGKVYTYPAIFKEENSYIVYVGKRAFWTSKGVKAVKKYFAIL